LLLPAVEVVSGAVATGVVAVIGKDVDDVVVAVVVMAGTVIVDGGAVVVMPGAGTVAGVAADGVAADVIAAVVVAVAAPVQPASNTMSEHVIRQKIKRISCLPENSVSSESGKKRHRYVISISNAVGSRYFGGVRGLPGFSPR